MATSCSSDQKDDNLSSTVVDLFAGYPRRSIDDDCSTILAELPVIAMECPKWVGKTSLQPSSEPVDRHVVTVKM